MISTKLTSIYNDKPRFAEVNYEKENNCDRNYYLYFILYISRVIFDYKNRNISKGIDVPTYFQIGYWPSVEMAIDYLAWGFFMGLAFLCLGIAIKNKDKTKRSIKTTLLTCGILCLIGFFGSIFINENIWYAAPMGYGIGTIIICIQMLKNSKYSK